MDIRALYKSLSSEDRSVYQSIRTDMRKVYLNAHTNIVGMEHWNSDDDYFMDLLDMKIATLFDRAGHIEGVKPIVDKEEEKTIEEKIELNGQAVTLKLNTEMSEASAKLSAMKPNGETW